MVQSEIVTTAKLETANKSEHTGDIMDYTLLSYTAPDLGGFSVCVWQCI